MIVDDESVRGSMLQMIVDDESYAWQDAADDC